MDHKDFCNHTRIKLIASAIGHQQCTKTASNIIPLPGTDRVIAIGTPEDVRGLLVGAPLTAPAPLTDAQPLIGKLLDQFSALPVLWGLNEPGALLRHSDVSKILFAAAREHKAAQAAPAPQQSELGIKSWQDRAAEARKRNMFVEDERFYMRAEIEEWRAKAALAAPVQTAEPKRMPDMLTVETIQGAIAFGRMGINPPPSTDHWGNEFWQIGRQLAKLGETSAWDNVTPVDVAAPVQAEQAQAEPSLNSKAKS